MSLPGLTRAVGQRLFLGRPATRVASCPVTAPNSSTAATALDLTQRTMLKLPFAVARWRIGFRNQNLRSATAYTTPCSITGVWAGLPTFDTGTSTAGRWPGNCTAAPTQVSTGLTVPVDGSRVWTSWITNSTFTKNTGKVISWGLTSAATGTGIASGNGYQGATAAGAANAGNQTLTSPSVAPNALYLDVVVEYEFAESVRLVMAIGDSNTLQYGLSPSLITSAGGGSLPHESWPMLAGAMGGFAVINLGVGSAQSVDWAVNYPALWDRLPSGCLPDAAFVSLGTNDLSAGITSFITYMQAIHTKIRTTYSCNTIWQSTITPRCFPDGAFTLGGTKVGGFLMADAAIGATSVSCSFSPATSAALLIGLGPGAEQRTVTAVTGSGPYAATVAGLTQNHWAGESISNGDESTRHLINNFLRQLPDAITGCFDFEKLLEATPGSFTMDGRYANSDYLHFIRSVGVLKASLILGTGVQPLFS